MRQADWLAGRGSPAVKEDKVRIRRPQPAKGLVCACALCQTEAGGGLDGVAGGDRFAFAVVAGPFPPPDVSAAKPVVDVEGNTIGLDFRAHVLCAV